MRFMGFCLSTVLFAFAFFGCGTADPSDLAGAAYGEGEPGSAVEFINLPPFNSRNNARWGVVLKDVVNHEAPGDSNNYDDMVTLAHETSHGIHSYIRNKMNNTGTRVNGFYVLADRAVMVAEPKMRKSQVAQYVPQSLRGSRYSTYITGATAWDDTPLYIWDEWNAYVNGAAAGVDQVQRGLWNAGWRDAVMGPLEFAAYAIASAMAVKRHDPTYFESNLQFREFLAWNLKRTMEIYRVGATMEQFKWDTQDRYYAAMKTGADAEVLRQFARDMFGAAWTLENLGF